MLRAMMTLRGSLQQQRRCIREAVRVLRAGGVIALPTETVYGLVCDPRNARAVRRIYAMKGRHESKPLQWIAGTVAQVRKVARIDRANQRVIARHWPGPLTLLLPVRRGLQLVPRVSERGCVGIRVSSLALVRDLTKAFGYPIAATSANVSGERPASSGRGVRSAFAQSACPDLLMDVGAIPRRRPTTVARVHADGRVDVVRQGSIRLSS
jgi:L-threonylcarbamoyladenylate synthase